MNKKAVTFEANNLQPNMIKHLVMLSFLSFSLLAINHIFGLGPAILVGISACWLELLHITEQTKK